MKRLIVCLRTGSCSCGFCCRICSAQPLWLVDVFVRSAKKKKNGPQYKILKGRIYAANSLKHFFSCNLFIQKATSAVKKKKIGAITMWGYQTVSPRGLEWYCNNVMMSQDFLLRMLTPQYMWKTDLYFFYYFFYQLLLIISILQKQQIIDAKLWLIIHWFLPMSCNFIICNITWILHMYVPFHFMPADPSKCWKTLKLSPGVYT